MELTLTIEQSVIEQTKRYAKKKECSISDLIESYLKAITKGSKVESVEKTPIVQALKGSFHMPDNFDYKKEFAKKFVNNISKTIFIL